MTFDPFNVSINGQTNQVKTSLQTDQLIVTRSNHIYPEYWNILPLTPKIEGAPVTQWVKRWPTDLVDRV